MTDRDDALTSQLRELSSRGSTVGPERLAASVTSTLSTTNVKSRPQGSRWMMAAATVGLCGVGVAGIALTQSGSGTAPNDAGPNLAAPTATYPVDETAPATVASESPPTPTYLLVTQPCPPVTFTFPASAGNVTLDVRTATFDSTNTGVFLSPVLTLQRGGADPDRSDRQDPTGEVVVTGAGDVTVLAALTNGPGPVAYGTLPRSDNDTNDLSNGVSSCDAWTLVARDQSVTVDDLVTLVEGLELSS